MFLNSAQSYFQTFFLTPPAQTFHYSQIPPKNSIVTITLVGTLKNFIAFSETDWEKLHDHLLKDYNKAVLPVLNGNGSLNVAFGVALVDMDLNEQDSTMTTDLRLRLDWQDKLLSWDPKDFGNINVMRIGL